MEKKLIIAFEIIFVIAAMSYYVVKDLIPEYKTKFGSSDRIVNPEKCTNMIEVKINDDIDYMTALRKGDWKLIYRHRTQALELYNLADDIGEQNNLAAAEPERLAELAEAMTAQLVDKGALMPTVRATGEPIPYPNQLINR